MKRMWKLLICADQFLGNLIFEGIREDETISAYVWRKNYTKRIALIDFFFGAGHCKAAFKAEMNGSHNAPEYRA